MHVVVGTYRCGTIDAHPAMFAHHENGMLQADTATTLRWVGRKNRHNLGAMPESYEFIIACDREEAAGRIENRAAPQRRRELWLTDAGREVLAAAGH